MSAHIERTIHPKNADESRTHLNRELITFPDGVENRTQAIQHRLDTAGLTRKIGNNQVKAIRVLLTGTHEDMERITHESTIETLQAKIQTMQTEHSRQMLDMQQKHIKELQVRDTEHKKEVSRLTALLNKTLKWFPQIKGMLNLEKLCLAVGFSIKNRQRYR